MPAGADVAEGVGLGVEDDGVEVDFVVRVLEEVEILEGLGEEEGLHAVVGLRVAADVGEAAVAVGRAALLLDGGEDLPAPVAVDGVLGDLVEDEEALGGLGAEEALPSGLSNRSMWRIDP